MGNAKLSSDEERVLKEQFMDGASLCIVTCEEKDVTPESVRLLLIEVPRSLKRKSEWATVYYFAVNSGDVNIMGKEELFREAVKQARKAGFHEAAVKLSEQVWEAEGETVARPMYIVPATYPPPYEPLKTAEQRLYPEGFRRPWYWKRLVLVGDAKHGSPPFLGQGIGMGVEDALVLVTNMAAKGVWKAGGAEVDVLNAVFEKYTTERMERVCLWQRFTANRGSEYNDDIIDEERNALWSFPYAPDGHCPG